MEQEFYKYQGAGNDFIIIDNRDLQFSKHLNPSLISSLCDRKFGVGADGLMVLQPHEGYDFEMLYYNADGHIGSMCGNGGRCIAAFSRFIGASHDETNFLAVDGPHHAKISANNEWVSLKMMNVSTVNRDGDAYVLNTGSPHFILQVDNLASKDVFYDGRKIRESIAYQEKGINVNFVEDKGDHYFVRTYERGVEDETLACGTGVTAVAMAMAIQKKQEGEIHTNIVVPGGELRVRFIKKGNHFTEVFLEGPSKQVFRGVITL